MRTKLTRTILTIAMTVVLLTGCGEHKVHDLPDSEEFIDEYGIVDSSDSDGNSDMSQEAEEQGEVEGILVESSVVDLGDFCIAYLVPNDETMRSIFWDDENYLGDHYIAIQAVNYNRETASQDDILYLPDIYGTITDMKMDSNELYLQYFDMESDSLKEVKIPIYFSERLENGLIDIHYSARFHYKKRIAAAQEGLQSGDTAFPQPVWTETFRQGGQIYEIAFERITPIYDYFIEHGGNCADYRLTVKDGKGDLISEQMLLGYPVSYEEVHWAVDFSGDGFMDLAFCTDEYWGHDSWTELLTLIWNSEKKLYEEQRFPQYQGDMHLWNADLSTVIAFAERDQHGAVIMEMHSFLQGEWKRVRRLEACFLEDKLDEDEDPVFLGFRELLYSAEGDLLEERAVEVDPEAGAPWFDEGSVWSGKNTANLKLYPEYPQWSRDYLNVGGIEVYKYTESEAGDKSAVHIMEEPLDDERINIRMAKLEKSTEEDSVMIQYPYLTDEDEISCKINEQIYHLLVPEDIQGNDGWADRADITFEITYVDDKLLSIYFTGYRDKGINANGGHFDIGLNFDLSNGELLCLADFYSLSKMRDLLDDAITEDRLSVMNIPLSENEFAEYVAHIFLESFEQDRNYINETNNFFIKKGKLYFLAEAYPSMSELTCLEMEIKEFP